MPTFEVVSQGISNLDLVLVVASKIIFPHSL